MYIGNLPHSATSGYLEDTFSSCGRVENIRLVSDRVAEQGHGFAFVEMSSHSEAQSVISKYNGTEYNGKLMKISEAKPMIKRRNDSRVKKGW